jgi:hypothetical protein
MLIGVILERLEGAIHLTERIGFSWRNLQKRLFASAHLCTTLILAGYIVLFLGLSNVLVIYELSKGPPIGLSHGLSLVLGGGLLYWLLLGIYQSIAQEQIENQDRRVPTHGIHLSLHNSLLLSLIAGTTIGGMGIVMYGLSNGSNGLSYFWFLFVVSSIPFWMITGGLAVWRHYLIRLLLRRALIFPLNACRFLEDATARILLRRFGGGYHFTHRLLLDALAEAEKDK